LGYSGKFTKKAMVRRIRGAGGLKSLLGTSDVREVVKRIEKGDQYAADIMEAQAYQIAKGVGLLAPVLKGECDAVILTGGLAYNEFLTDAVREYIGFIAPVAVIPGEFEMEALARGGLRIMLGQETVNEF